MTRQELDTIASELLALLKKFNPGTREVFAFVGGLSVFVSSERAASGVVLDLTRIGMKDIAVHRNCDKRGKFVICASSV